MTSRPRWSIRTTGRPIDRLTGVANRQSLLAALFDEVERATRYGRPLSVAFVDIDHFKAVNDTYGHAVGDVVLRGVAQTIAENLRASDMIGRYGGEEFMLILTETDVEEGSVLTEKLRASSRRSGSRSRARQRSPSRSRSASPVAQATSFGWTTLVRDADAAMYSAKSLGRNQTYVFAEPDDDARVPRAPISAAGRARPSRSAQARRRRQRRSPRCSPLCPTTRPAVGAHRVDRRRRWPTAAAARTPRSTVCASRAAARRRQGRGAGGDPREAVAR
jgi:diguanylate cyclase (GGDEF)-like protein